MVSRVSETSRRTLWRFGLKVACALSIATVLSRTNFLLSLSMWISLFSTASTFSALIHKEKMFSHEFNNWDESLWLMTIGLGLRELARLL